MPTVVQKKDAVCEQLGIDSSLPMKKIIQTAAVTIGILEHALEGKNIAEQFDLLCQELGIELGRHETVYRTQSSYPTAVHGSTVVPHHLSGTGNVSNDRTQAHTLNVHTTSHLDVHFANLVAIALKNQRNKAASLPSRPPPATATDVVAAGAAGATTTTATATAAAASTAAITATATAAPPSPSPFSFGHVFAL